MLEQDCGSIAGARKSCAGKCHPGLISARGSGFKQYAAKKKVSKIEM